MKYTDEDLDLAHKIDDNLAVPIEGVAQLIRDHVEAQCKPLVEALEWCGGSNDFQHPNGIACEGYDKLVRPLISAYNKTKEQSND